MYELYFVDIDSNGILDEVEVEALFQNEVDYCISR